MSAAAIAGALAMTFLLLGFARRRRLTNARLLLVGVALGIVCSALMTWRSISAPASICGS